MRLSIHAPTILRLVLLVLLLFTSATTLAAWSSHPDGQNIFATKQEVIDHWITSLEEWNCGSAAQCKVEADSIVSSTATEEEWLFKTYKGDPWTFIQNDKRSAYFYDGGCTSPEEYHLETDSCITPVEPEQCWETGDLFNSETAECQPECEGMILDGYCMVPDDNDEGCETDDVWGSSGWGHNQEGICQSDKDACEEDGGTYGLMNGEATCIPEGYGADTICDSDSLNLIVVNNGSGFTCERVGPDPEEEPEEPNTDTDGDGEPDEYDPANDPMADYKQGEDALGALEEANQHLSNIDSRLEGIADNGVPGTGGGSQPGDGGDGGDEGDQGVCEGASELCEGVSNIEDALGAEPESPSAEPGSFEIDGLNSELDTVNGELESQLDSIKGELETYFDFSPSVGVMSFPYSLDVMDTTLSICPDVYKEELAVIGTVLLALSILASVIIMLR